MPCMNVALFNILNLLRCTTCARCYIALCADTATLHWLERTPWPIRLHLVNTNSVLRGTFCTASARPSICMCVRCCCCIAAQDGGETDDAVMMVTEPAVPLAGWLVANKPGPGASASARTDFSAACVWGVYSLTTALSFLASCDLVHGNVSLDSVWVRAVRCL